MGRGERVKAIDASCLENLSLINFNSTGIPRDMVSKTSRYLSLETIARSRATRKKKRRESTSEKTKEEKWRERSVVRDKDQIRNAAQGADFKACKSDY